MTLFKVKNDTALRKKWFVPDAMSHPAKGHIVMWQEIIERYTKEGDWILDVMAGIGTSMVAALMGRNVICNEMEPHFIAPMVASWDKMRQQPLLGYDVGEVVIIRGDARQLAVGSADSIVTSPPWEESIHNARDNGLQPRPGDIRYDKEAGYTRKFGLGYTRSVDAVVSSPPYANRLAVTYVDDDPQRMSYTMGAAKIDAVVSSPPYEGSIGEHDESPDATSKNDSRGIHERQGYALNGGQNIGNLKNDAYWEAMEAVYRECWRVLKPGGVMALVLKGFTRDGKYVDLPGQTQEMCERLGFTLFDHWKRELWGLSFWRILQKRRDPAAFDERLQFEEILAFRKASL